MFGADAEADDPSGNAAQVWNSSKQPQRKRRLERSGLTQDARNDPALDDDLQPLRHSGG
jgi:hypothetical protein